MGDWKLTLAGVTRTAAEWGVEKLAISTGSLVPDLFTFTAVRATFDLDALCPFDGQVILTGPDGVVRFVGSRQLNPGAADGQSESQDYTIAGPWHWLEETDYQQLWFGGAYTSHLLLLRSVGAEIKTILDFAIANGAGFQYVAAELEALSVFPPTNEISEQKCSAVIIQLLQYAPDVVSWFDYSTTPTPTLHFQRRGSLTAVDLRLASHTANLTAPICSALKLTPLPNRQIPSAKINFEVLVTIDGEQFLQPSTEIYPPSATGLEKRGFNAVIQLQGSTIQNVFGSLECESVDYTSLAWWQKHVPTLNSSAVIVFAGPENISVSDRDGNPIAEADRLPRELLPGGGAIAPWMTYNGQDVVWQTEIVKATFFIETYEIDEENGAPSDLPVRTEHKQFSVEILTTNAPAGESSYQAVATEEEGDPMPVGLAREIYDALNPLQYDALFAIEQEECTFFAGVGKAINLLGSRAEYASMRAMVQQATYDLDTGLTTLKCGPPEHLTLSQLRDLMMRFRTRRRYTNAAAQSSGEVGGSGGDLELGKASANTNAVPGSSVSSLFAVKGGDTLIKLDAGGKRLRFDGDRVMEWNNGTGIFAMSPKPGTGEGSVLMRIADTGGKTLQFRIMPVCTPDGVKSVIGLFSEIF